MAFRLKLVPDNTAFNFFRWQWLSFGVSAAAMVGSVLLLLVMGLNFGIDFKGGTTIRTESPTAFEVGDYRQAMSDLDLGDVSITEVFDPAFGTTKHVAMIRIGTTDETGSVTPEQLNEIEAALKTVDPQVVFAAVESVGPKVSGELIKTALYAVGAATIGIMFYIWLRFDLTTIAALLTTLGFSCNDTVVVFDRLRENLIKYKTRPLLDLMNLTCNETLSRTIMTAVTTAIALTAMLIFGGDVIRDFVIAMLWGVIVGCYSTIYVAKNIVLWLGVKRDWSKPGPSEKAPGEDIPAAFRDAP